MNRLTVKEAAGVARRHPKTVLNAVESGDLHGAQRTVRGKWLIQEQCLDAWLEGQPCSHKNVTPLRRRAS